MNSRAKKRLISARTRYYLAKNHSWKATLALRSWRYWALVAAKAAKTPIEAQLVYHLSPSLSRGQKIAWRKMKPLFKRDSPVTRGKAGEKTFFIVVKIVSDG